MNKHSKSASLILAGLLHVAPLATRILQSSPGWAASPVAIVMTWALRVAAIAGAYHTVSAASAVLASATTVSGTQGTRLSYQIRISDGENRTPGSWRLDGTLFPNTGSTTRGMPPGLSIHLGTGIISGTPTAGGSFPTTITAYENPGGTGASLTFTVTFNITAITQPTVITNQPAGRGLHPGETWALTVGASGTAPFTYRWRKDNADITGATAATLALSNVTAAAAGSYAAVVTGGGGSVTSNPALLTVTELRLRATSHTAASTTLNLQTAPGRRYLLQSTTSLNPIAWVDAGQVSAVTSTTNLTDVTAGSQRYWRYSPLP